MGVMNNELILYCMDMYCKIMKNMYTYFWLLFFGIEWTTVF